MAKRTTRQKREIRGKTIRTPRLVAPLLKDIRQFVDSARERAASAVNSELVWMYWQIGNRIRRVVLSEQRAEYGKQIVDLLSTALTSDYGPGFTRRNLFNMLKFAEVCPDESIVHTMRAQLGWSHIRQIIYLDDPLQRDFYAQMCRIERWSSRTLDEKIRTLLFERTVLSRRPTDAIARQLADLKKSGRVTPELVFRDPYVLDFLGLTDGYCEKDIEAAVCRELERFLLEIGTDFAFVARQKRITVDHEDYYLDLLFFHRRLRRLVAIDLKLGKFQAADKCQMELYLNWLDLHERQPGEESPVGLILCGGKSEEHIELLRLEQTGIRVAQYMTELPPRRVLEQKLHKAIHAARARLNARETRPA